MRDGAFEPEVVRLPTLGKWLVKIPGGDSSIRDG